MTLFFLLPRGADAPRASHTNFDAREPRGRREDNRTSSISVGLLEILLKVLEVGQLTIVDNWWHWWVTSVTAAALSTGTEAVTSTSASAATTTAG